MESRGTESIGARKLSLRLRISIRTVRQGIEVCARAIAFDRDDEADCYQALRWQIDASLSVSSTE
jgi:hypothetical protein